MLLGKLTSGGLWKSQLYFHCCDWTKRRNWALSKQNASSDEAFASLWLSINSSFFFPFLLLFNDSVFIQEDHSKKEYQVVGRFPLVGPWWRVNVKVKKMGAKYFLQGYPSYFLRTDIEENNRQVFSLFLTACDVPEAFRRSFFAWLPMDSLLSFRNLEEKLKQFQVSQVQTEKQQRITKDCDIFYYVSKSRRYMLCCLDCVISCCVLSQLLASS